MKINWRIAGTALLLGTIGSTIGVQLSGSPGGDYTPAAVRTYLDPGHYGIALISWYVVALSALTLLAFGYALRSLGGWAGEIIWGLSVAATAVAVSGSYLAGGFIAALAEGGAPVRSDTSGPTVYLFGEIGNLMATTAPFFLIGVAAIVLAIKAGLPRWLRVLSVIGGVCGILEPLYFVIPGLMLWALAFGIWAIVHRTAPVQSGADLAPAPQS